jgi:PAS domain S-box-containing protein
MSDLTWDPPHASEQSGPASPQAPSRRGGLAVQLLFATLVLAGLGAISQYNTLLFHSLIELTSFVVAASIFVLAWNARRLLDNDFLLFLGIAWLFVGGLDLLHVLAQKGIGVFPGAGDNLDMQLWLAGRYLKGLSLLASPVFLHRKVNLPWMLAVYSLLAGLTLGAIGAGQFPVSYIDGQGLTYFAVASGMLVTVIYLAALARLFTQRRLLDQHLWRLLAGSIVASVGDVLISTVLINVYGPAEILGPFFKLLAFYLLYKAIVENGLRRPYAVLFQALQKERDQSRQYLQIAGVLVVVIDTRGRIRLINRRGCDILGYREDELVGQDWFEVCLPEGERNRVGEIFEALLAGQVAPGEYSENSIVTKSGEVRWVAFHNAILYGEAGQISGVLTSGEDITERRHSAELIRAQYEQLQAQHEELQAQAEALAAAADETRQLNLALEQRVAERTAQWQAANAELHQANSELTQALRAKDEFLAAMSHELRTPLTAILGLTESLQMDIYGALNDKQRRVLVTVYESGQHLLAIISDILDLAKVTVGKLAVQLRPVSIAEVCQASLSMISAQAEQKHLTVSLTRDPAAVQLLADERRLTQILVNLLNNAVKFTPAGGAIGLAVTPDDSRRIMHFTVWDTGIGIAPAEAPRLFKPFVQLDGRLAREYGGTGLGLSLAQGLTELQGGSLRLESEGLPGRGSRFILTLPWTPPTAERSPGSSTLDEELSTPPHQLASVDPRPSASPVVLLVDDSEASLMVVQDYLQSIGYTVIAAREGREALALAHTWHPAIIVMDLQMPGMDGLEAIRRLRTDSNAPLAATPIIALTALAMPGDHERCLAAGANAYVSKPIHLPELAGVLAALIASPASPSSHSDSGDLHAHIQ